MLREIDIFKQPVCMNFHFKDKSTDTIFFTKADCIFSLNFNTN